MKQKDPYFYKKLFIYLIGILVLAIGSNLFLNASLGIAPSCALALTLTFLLPAGYAFFNFLINLILLGMECFVLHSFGKTQIVQLIITFVYSALIQLLSNILSIFQPHSFYEQFILAIIACIIMGAGITLTLLSNFVVMPMEGFVGAIAFKIKKEFGKVRVVIDIVMTVLAALVSLIFLHSIVSVGIGTIISAFLTGSIVSLCTKLWKTKLDVFMGFTSLN